MEQRQVPIVLALIRNEQGEILMPKRNDPTKAEIHGKWEFPGGGIEFGEDPEAAIIRECKEETGLDVEVVRLLPKIYYNLWNNPDGSSAQVFLLCYECKVLGGRLGSTDREIAELKFFKPSEIDHSKCLPKTKEIIELLNQ